MTGGGRSGVITGATSGLGRAAAEALAGLGYRLWLVARDPHRVSRSVAEIRDRTGNREVEGLVADLRVLAEVRRVGDELAERAGDLVLLLNNVGGVSGLRRTTTVDGIEENFALNHLASFQLTLRLLESLRRAAPARVINVASDAWTYAGGSFPFDDPQAERRYRLFRQYGVTKLANILFTDELARRLAGSGVGTLAWSPAGLTATHFAYGVGGVSRLVMKLTHPFAMPVAKAVQPLVEHCDRDVPPESNGRFFVGDEDRPREVAPCTPGDARRLWALSEALVEKAIFGA